MKCLSFLTLSVLVGCASISSSMNTKDTIDKFVTDSKGRKIAIRELGAGTPIVVLPGGPAACGAIYLDSLKALAHSNRLIFWDYRGCGRSDQEGPYSIQSDLADLQTVIDKLNLVRPILLVTRMAACLHSSFPSKIKLGYAD